VHTERLLRMAFLVPNPTDSNAMEKTSEHVLWVSMMLASLAGGGDLRGHVGRP
jgi:hypothetical protein